MRKHTLSNIKTFVSKILGTQKQFPHPVFIEKDYCMKSQFMQTATHQKQLCLCQSHNFTISPKKHGLYLKQPIAVSFCKGKIWCLKHGGRRKYQPTCCCCLPVFNKDGSHATNAFILPDDQGNYIEDKQRLKEEHENNLLNNSEGKSQLVIEQFILSSSQGRNPDTHIVVYAGQIMMNTLSIQIPNPIKCAFTNLISITQLWKWSKNITPSLKSIEIKNFPNFYRKKIPLSFYHQECQVIDIPRKKVKRDPQNCQPSIRQTKPLQSNQILPPPHLISSDCVIPYPRPSFDFLGLFSMLSPQNYLSMQPYQTFNSNSLLMNSFYFQAFITNQYENQIILQKILQTQLIQQFSSHFFSSDK